MWKIQDHGDSKFTVVSDNQTMSTYQIPKKFGSTMNYLVFVFLESILCCLIWSDVADTGTYECTRHLTKLN